MFYTFSLDRGSKSANSSSQLSRNFGDDEVWSVKLCRTLALLLDVAGVECGVMVEDASGISGGLGLILNKFKSVAASSTTVCSVDDINNLDHMVSSVSEFKLSEFVGWSSICTVFNWLKEPTTW